jgi:hypothetical protein
MVMGLLIIVIGAICGWSGWHAGRRSGRREVLTAVLRQRLN